MGFDTLKNWQSFCCLFLRIALALIFLSAVADRFGLWGAHGTKYAVWGDFKHFVDYTAQLNPFLPPNLILISAWTTTILETVLGIMLLIGIYTRFAATASGILLLLFAIAMTLALGVKAPLDYSVFAASAGAFLLGAVYPS